MLKTKKFPFKQPGGRIVTATWFTDDNSTSCNCVKWLRNIEPDGSRICEHTKEIKRLNPQAKARTDRSPISSSVSISVPANTPVTVQSTPGTKVTVTTNSKPTGTSRRFDWGE